MATEYLLPNGDDSGWTTNGASTACSNGINSGTPNDTTYIESTANEGDVINIDLASVVTVGDSDTVTSVTVRFRAESSNSNDGVSCDLIVGGTAQGTQYIGAASLGGTFSTYTADGATQTWTTDYTAAQLNGAQVRFTTTQTGMPGACDVRVSEVEVDITYTPGGLTEDPLLGELDLLGYAPTAVIANNVSPTTDSLDFTGYAPTRAEITIEPGTAPLRFIYVIGLKLEGQPLTIDVGGGDNTELPLLGELDLTGTIPTTIVANNIPVPLASPSPTITGYAPTIVQAQVELPLLGTLALGIAGSAPSAIVANITAPDTIGLSIAEQTPIRLVGDIREPSTDALVLGVVGSDLTVLHDRVSAPDTIALSLDGKDASVGGSVTKEPGLDELAFGSVKPDAIVGHVVAPGLDELDLAGKIPTLGPYDNPEIPGTDSLALSSDVITVTHNRVAIPDTVGLSLDGKLPIVPGVGTIEVPTGSLNIYKYVGLKLDGFPPTPVINTPVLPTTIGLSLSGQNVTLDAAVSPSTIGLSLSGTTPTLDASVLPSTGSLELQGYQLADQDAIIVPVGALSLDGKQPGLKGVTSPTTGSLTISPLSPTSDYQASPDVSLGSIAFSSDAPSAVQSHITAPGTVALSLDGKIPLRFVDTAGSSTRVPKEAELTLSGQSAAVKDLSTVDPLGVSLSLSGSIPTVDVGETASPGTGALSLYSEAKVLNTGALSLTGQPVTIWYRDGVLIENPQASTDIISNVNECDLTGFKQMPGSMKLQWNKYAVRSRSFDQRHPSDIPHRTHTQRKRGPQRPEPTDTFLDTDVSPEDL